MSDALDRFFEHYYRRRPVNATFTGVHEFDALLPDWSPSGLSAMDDEMSALIAELSEAHPAPASVRGYCDDVNALDAELARGFLEIQLAENASRHGVTANPSLWIGDAIFSIISLMIREFTSVDDRILSVTRRLELMPAFLADAYETVDTPIPAAWTAKALRECEGAAMLLERGIDLWIDTAPPVPARDALCRIAAARARVAVLHFAEWLRTQAPAPDETMACGPEHYDLLLTRGHYCHRSRADLLADARAEFSRERARLDAMAMDVANSWRDVQERLAADHPPPADYIGAFARAWKACRDRATSEDVVTWPDWPIQYVTFPPWTRDAAPYLYYLYYRSPAPFDPYTVYDYAVPQVPSAPNVAEQFLRTWNRSVIKLNHVVHHGAIGHHVQNWHAYHRATSRVGTIAAVDCASRIGMFCGGTMAEGWACYATALMEELGFLSPLERVAEQHSRVRFLARAIVDIELHQGTISFSDAVLFYVEQVGMSADAAQSEAVKNSMYPCTALMYWLGTQSILDLRETMRRRRRSAWSLKAFHDELLGFGSIPVPLVAQMMTSMASI
jgi:hypothetical protein